MVTPEPQPRDHAQEREFLASIFTDFDSSVIDQVLKEFPSVDDAFCHLQEFMDFDLGDEDELGPNEEAKHGAAAAGSMSPRGGGFDVQNIHRVSGIDDENAALGG